MSNHNGIGFLRTEEPPVDSSHFYDVYKVLIADDDSEFHLITKMVLQDFAFECYRLEFLDAYSGKEAKRILEQNPDIAILLLDVVMEDTHSGLDVVRYLRKNLNNPFTRIILRTGQPGEAPEETIIRDYDINDYQLKTDMTVQRIKTSLYAALRNYRDLARIENNRKGLEKIIKASSNMFTHQSIDQLFENILEQLSTFRYHKSEMLYVKENHQPIDAFVTQKQDQKTVMRIGTGKYEKHVGQDMEKIVELRPVFQRIQKHTSGENQVISLENGVIIAQNISNMLSNYIYIETKGRELDIDLVKVFMSNYSFALENYLLSNMINSTQTEIITTFADTVEKHFEETGSHVKRISNMMYQFGLKMQFSYTECEALKVASTMHDIGKIAIPDSILKKPGKLTEEEYHLVQEHTQVGYSILSKSELSVLQTAAEIALYHHEKYDGTGYPKGLKGKEIPLRARMMAIVDVFDAITHKRVYKDPQPVQYALDFITENKGIHFDSELVPIFMNHYSEIVENMD